MRTSLLPAVILLAAGLAARGQTPEAPDLGGETPPPNSTVIQSDELHMDQVSHIAVFNGNVLVTGTNFSMKCQEMTVDFDKEGKVDTILAKGDVEIIQPGRVTHSGQVVYTKADDKFVLTDQPVIVDNKDKISAPKIIIYRGKQSMYTEGKTTTVLPEGSALSSTPSTSSTDQK